METISSPSSNALSLANELRSRWFFRHTKSLVLVLVELLCYVLALVSLVSAILFVKVVMGIAEIADTVVVMDGDLFAALIIVVQVLLFVFAFGFVLLARFMHRSRKQRVLVQRLCDAVIEGK